MIASSFAASSRPPAWASLPRVRAAARLISTNFVNSPDIEPASRAIPAALRTGRCVRFSGHSGEGRNPVTYRQRVEPSLPGPGLRRGDGSRSLVNADGVIRQVRSSERSNRRPAPPD
jgi:hypothetical protein